MFERKMVKRVKMTLNLYDNNKVPNDRVREKVIDKNPIIFIIPRDAPGEVYNTVNCADWFRKSICILEGYNLARAFSYIYSFKELQNRKIMIVAPKKSEIEAKNMAIIMNRLLKQYGRTIVKTY